VSKIADTFGREAADQPTTQVPVVRDDNPPTSKIPVIKDDNPPTSKIPVIKDDDQPTTIRAAGAVPAFVRVSTPSRPPSPVPPTRVPLAPVDPVVSAAPASAAAADITPAVKPIFIAPDPEPAVPQTAEQPPAPDVPDGKTPKRRKRWLVPLIAVLVVALAAAGTLIGLATHYNGKAKIGTQVAGVNVAGQTAADLAATAQSVGGDFTITTDLNGTQKTFSMTDLGVTLDAQKTAQQALAADQGAFGWVPFNSADVPLAYTYSADQIQQTLTTAFLTDDQLPQDATVTFDDSTGKYTSTPDKAGLTIDAAPVTSAIDTIARGGKVSTVELSTTSVPAAVQAAAADTAVSAADALVGQTYTFTAGSKSVTLTPSQIGQFVTLTPNQATGAIDVGVDQTSMASSLPGILSAALAKAPVNERDLYTPDGSKFIAVGTAGQNGTIVADADATAAVQALSAAMTAGQPLTQAVTITPQKFGVDKVNVGGAYDQPNGSKWIDVNQSTFKVTLYQGTTAVQQFTAVTGTADHPTNDGTFYIYLRYASQTMHGPDYVQPDVPWVSYFDGGRALHGAYWRTTFGYRGSHGCVNLPVSAAKVVYDWAPLGTKVVVHH